MTLCSVLDDDGVPCGKFFSLHTKKRPNGPRPDPLLFAGAKFEGSPVKTHVSKVHDKHSSAEKNKRKSMVTALALNTPAPKRVKAMTAKIGVPDLQR